MRETTANPPFDVLSYGTIGLDEIARVPQWPRPDVSVHTHTPVEHLGGKATNTAARLAGWGLAVAVSGTVIGQDEIGRKLLDTLMRHPNIRTDFLETRADVASMHCLILVNPQGERAIIGINADHHPSSKPTQAMIRSAKALTLDLYGGKERVLAARLARRAGLPVIVGDLRRIDHPVLRYTTIAVASAAELRREHPGAAMKEIGKSILAQGVTGVVITDGAEPALVMSGAGHNAAIAPAKVRVVDTIGAGDACRAGIVYGIVNGYDLIDCARFGVAAGSQAVTCEGAATTLSSLEDLHRACRRCKVSAGTAI